MLRAKILYSIALMLMMLGCSNHSANPPSWYGKSVSSESSFVGFGSARDLDSAKANALNDIVTQLNVVVSSHFSSATQRQDSMLSYNSSSEVYLDNLGMELSNVSYTKSVLENQRYYVQAEIAKKSIIMQLQKSFNSTYSKLNTQNMNRCASSLSIKDKTILERSLKDLQSYALLLQTLGSSTKSLQNLETILNVNTPLPSAKLIVESNLPSDKISSDIAKELGYFYVIQGDSTHTLKATVKVDNPNSRNAKIDIIFSIHDCRNNPIFNTNVSFEANNTKEALSFASKRVSVQLYKKIQEWIGQ